MDTRRSRSRWEKAQLMSTKSRKPPMKTRTMRINRCPDDSRMELLEMKELRDMDLTSSVS